MMFLSGTDNIGHAPVRRSTARVYQNINS